MTLRDTALERLAEMVIGEGGVFPYKSSSYITSFFERCGLPFVHDGSTRKWWVKERLKELNSGISSHPELPSDELMTVMTEMFDIDDCERNGKSVEAALETFNHVMGRHGLVAELNGAVCVVRSTGTGAGLPASSRPRPHSPQELEQRAAVERFLETSSEDEFTERLLVPLFQRLGFCRVSFGGHSEKSLEYGKDLWMKFQLPTAHWIYFAAQVKKGKLDAKGANTPASANIATVLNQVQMAEHMIFDPDIGRKVLVDHIFVISAGEITRAAQNWLAEKLDVSKRRQLIFMGRGELLDHSARIMLDLGALKVQGDQLKIESARK